MIGSMRSGRTGDQSIAAAVRMVSTGPMANASLCFQTDRVRRHAACVAINVAASGDASSCVAAITNPSASIASCS
jgi:hypothetical protein